MARLAARCYTCRSNVRGSLVAHNATATHRAKVARENMPRSTVKDRPSWALSQGDQYAHVTEAEHAAAAARMAAEDRLREGYAPSEPAPIDFAGTGYVPTDWTAPEKTKTATNRRTGTQPVMAPRVVAQDGGPKGPCPRCGRSDWRTPAGRTWHVENNPDCAKYRRTDRHQYATA